MKKITLLAALAALALSLPVAAQEAKLNDAQIAHVAYTAGQIDIKAAEQALEKSKNPTVVEFAQEMERDHKAVNQDVMTLAKAKQVEIPAPSAEQRANEQKLDGLPELEVEEKPVDH